MDGILKKIKKFLKWCITLPPEKDYTIYDYSPEKYEICTDCQGTGGQDMFTDCFTCDGKCYVKKEMVI